MFKKDDYIHLKKVVIEFFTKKGYSRDNVSEYACMSGIPLVILYEFIAEEFPEHEKDCKEQEKRIKEYFDY